MFNKKLVTPELVQVAHELFKEIFPNETLYEDGTLESCFSRSAALVNDEHELWHYWVWSLSTPEAPMGFPIGLSGIYTEESDPDSAWLGWLGVISKYRRERFGTRILNDFLREARDRGFKFARLYTNDGNVAAKALYEFNGFTKETLNFDPPDYVKVGGEVIIYSKSLIEGQELVPWNSRPLVF